MEDAGGRVNNVTTVVGNFEGSIFVGDSHRSCMDQHNPSGPKLNETLFSIIELDKLEIRRVPFVQSWLIDKEWLAVLPGQRDLTQIDTNNGNGRVYNDRRLNNAFEAFEGEFWTFDKVIPFAQQTRSVILNDLGDTTLFYRDDMKTPMPDVL